MEFRATSFIELFSLSVTDPIETSGALDEVCLGGLSLSGIFSKTPVLIKETEGSVICVDDAEWLAASTAGLKESAVLNVSWPSALLL